VANVAAQGAAGDASKCGGDNEDLHGCRRLLI
jgi:hypothetical protein